MTRPNIRSIAMVLLAVVPFGLMAFAYGTPIEELRHYSSGWKSLMRAALFGAIVCSLTAVFLARRNYQS